MSLTGPSNLPETPMAVIGTLTAFCAAAWALLRWLFWPRVQATIRAEVTAVVEELRRETSDHLASMDRGISRIAEVAEELRREVTQQGKQSAATAKAIEILVEVDRRSGTDRRNPS